MKTAIILGASGLTGSLLLKRLLSDPDYAKVKVFTRNSLGNSDPKIEEFICDVIDLELQENNFKGDVVFCCIGTTKKKTPDKSIYYKIDYGIPVTAAKLCVKNEIDTIVVVSALGANVKSSIFYSRTKGEMEKAISDLQIKNIYFMQPSFIGGDRSESRAGEKMGISIFKFIQPILIGPLRKFRLILADTIAKAMIKVAKIGYKKSVLESDEIESFAK